MYIQILMLKFMEFGLLRVQAEFSFCNIYSKNFAE